MVRLAVVGERGPNPEAVDAATTTSSHSPSTSLASRHRGQPVELGRLRHSPSIRTELHSMGKSHAIPVRPPMVRNGSHQIRRLGRSPSFPVSNSLHAAAAWLLSIRGHESTRGQDHGTALLRIHDQSWGRCRLYRLAGYESAWLFRSRALPRRDTSRGRARS